MRLIKGSGRKFAGVSNPLPTAARSPAVVKDLLQKCDPEFEFTRILLENANWDVAAGEED
jgi:hypothetical protein